MRVEYDKKMDILTIIFRDARIKESDELRPGMIVDFGHDGGVVSIEIDQASKVVGKTSEIQFAIAE
jgi:uncharacterized protein YuzE